MQKQERTNHRGNHRGSTTKSKTIKDNGLNGHKMIDCPKFVKMDKIFHGKFMAIIEVQLIAKI